MFVIGIIFGIATSASPGWPACSGLCSRHTFVFTFVWMRGTCPVRIDQLMNFAWKWLMELAFINIFVTAGAIILIEYLRRP